MKDGIHIPAIAVRAMVLAAVAAVIALVWTQIPEARRYLKMELM